MDQVYFRAGFDGTPKATLRGKTISPKQAANLQYEPSDQTKALVVGTGTHVQYRLGAGFPSEAGALEIRFRPNFPQKAEQPERTILALTGSKGCRITLSFKRVGFRWEFLVKVPRRKRLLRVWYGRVKRAKWNHLLLVWDKKADPRAMFTLFHGGKCAEAGAYDFKLSGLTWLAIGGAHDSGVSVDEIVIYRRALTQSQAGFLPTSFKLKNGRFAALAERTARDQREERERRAGRAAQVEQLKGKVGRLIHLRGDRPQNFAFPEGVKAVGIQPEDVGKIDLSRFEVIQFPPGGRYQLTPSQQKRIVAYVRNGGGYVGVCLGAYFADQIGILDFDCYGFRELGLVRIKLQRHPVTEGLEKTICVHHGNGPIMNPRKGCEAVGAYEMGFPSGQTPGAILVGKCGKGRVVLFGPHPRGGGVAAVGRQIHFSGRELGTDRLQINALLWAAGITGQDAPNGTAKR